MSRFKIMLITVGGTKEPIIKSIENYKPEKVFFLCSQKTLDIAYQVFSELNYKPLKSYEIIENENDLMECFEKYNSICNKVRQQVKHPSEIIIDYTGGTKNMTAALVLASSGKGFFFSYIGGTERSKEGIGIVITGNEKLYKQIDPFEFFKLETKKKFCNYFNEYKFESALELCKELSETGNERDRLLFTYLTDIVSAFLNWDKFRHKNAQKQLKKGITRIRPLINYEKSLKEFIDNCEKNSQFLNSLVKNLKDNKSEVSWELILDLFANAERRYKENRFDDSIARVYRTLEMIAQFSFYKEFGYTTSNISLEKIPKELQNEYTKYIDPISKKLKFGCYAAFKILENINNQFGKVFMNPKNNFEGLLKIRNNSILAHGSSPIEKVTNEEFLNKVKEEFKLNNYPIFPKLPDYKKLAFN